MKTVTLLITLFLCIPCMAQPGKKVKEKRTYNNPVIDYSLPDPTIIKADDGYFYLYATEDIRNLPILLKIYATCPYTVPPTSLTGSL